MTATLADLAAVERLIGALPKKTRKKLAELPGVRARLLRWQPNPGPQTEAYYSKSDCLLYGGEPGGGKSQLILGLAFNEHKRSFVMRREYGDLERLIEDALKINGGKQCFNGSPPPRLRLSGDDRAIYFRAAHRIGDEQGTMGQGRDLLGIDEAAQFGGGQVLFMMGGVRTEAPNQRCRTVLATNPPLTAEGLWIVKMFAPWLDDGFSNPAKAGELRWVITDQEGKDEWVGGPDAVREVTGKIVSPTSRTFIPASVIDNPYYVDTEYRRQLDAMPEPYRSLLMGGFRTQFRDAERQVIPSAWIKAAQARWRDDGWKAFEMTAMALDPAGGGKDAAVLAWRHGGWYAPLVSLKGADTADGSAMAAAVIRSRRSQAPVIIDMGGGYGGDVSSRLKENGIAYQVFKGELPSSATGRGGLRFF